jgi:hypothetical protein
MTFSEYLYSMMTSLGYNDVQDFLKATGKSVFDYQSAYNTMYGGGGNLSFAIPVAGEITNQDTVMGNVNQFSNLGEGIASGQNPEQYEFDYTVFGEDIPLDVIEQIRSIDEDIVPEEYIPTEPIVVTPEPVIPNTVIEEGDNMIYKPLGEDLAGFLADEGDRWTPANGFLDAASIVNPGQALVYGLGTIGGNVAQGLFDNAGMDVAITADRAKDKQYLNRYADLIGADLVMKDGKYMFGYNPEQAELAGLQEGASGYTLNGLRQMIGLEPIEKGDIEVENSILESVIEALGNEKQQQDKTANEYYSYRTSNVTGLGGSSGTTDDTSESSIEDILRDTGTDSTTLSEDEDDNETFVQRVYNKTFGK